MIVELTKWDGGQAHTIRVEIDDQGNVKALVGGIQGPACSDISKFLDGLGTVTRDDPTPEFYQTATEAEYQQTGW
jgi:hypothetical protein